MNKFIKKYPQFWVPAVGDRVQVKIALDSNFTEVNDSKWDYKVGDKGIIMDIVLHFVYIRFDITNLVYCLYREEVELI